MPDKPTFGRYSEIPYEQMTPEQQEAYRSLIETRGGLLGPNKIWVHNPKLGKLRDRSAPISNRAITPLPNVSARSPSASSPVNGIRPSRLTRTSGSQVMEFTRFCALRLIYVGYRRFTDSDKVVLDNSLAHWREETAMQFIAE